MKQETIVRISSEDEKMTLLCGTETPIGALHDFLMIIRKNLVERMQQAQKEEEKATEAVTTKAEEEEKVEAVVE